MTSALSEREAQQSGGIQATSRNVGQAFGVAILGSVMLFSLTGAIKSNVAEHESYLQKLSKSLLNNLLYHSYQTQWQLI
ncbi:hypothetical protein OGZ01_10215 [Vibrio harveyi]|nr:hypothetical protein [Vibrio harveyi]